MRQRVLSIVVRIVRRPSYYNPWILRAVAATARVDRLLLDEYAEVHAKG